MQPEFPSAGGAAGADPSAATSGPPPLPGPRPGRSPWRRAGAVWLAVIGVGAALVAAQLLRSRDGSGVRHEAQAGAAAIPDIPPTRSLSWRPVKGEPGVQYANDRIRGVPWSVHIVQVDRRRADLGFYSAHAGTRVTGVAVLADQAAGVPAEVGRAVAGVNGDFYDRDNRLYAGDPRGLQIIQGELTSAPHTVCVWFDAAGQPHLDEVKGEFTVTWPGGARVAHGLNQRRADDAAVLYAPNYATSTRTVGGRELVLEREGEGPWLPLRVGQTLKAKVRAIREEGNGPIAPETMVLSFGPRYPGGMPETAVGAVLEISTRTTPDVREAVAAIGGGPALLQPGQAFTQTNPPPGLGNNYSERSKYERHPRSAIGWNAAYFYLVTVDGRQPGLSVGMKLAELADYFQSLGCTHAMNLDGGKSAQMWVAGRIANDPCQGEDTVANSLMVVRKPTAR
ncbi:MAG: hypothetical protein RJA22_3164 [Verrucomicrobiota bacterium]